MTAPGLSKSPGTTKYRYCGAERDEESGFYCMGARYYCPWLGRWTTMDPIGLAGGVNPAAYCRGSPVTLSDPSGLDAVPAVLIPDPVCEDTSVQSCSAPAIPEPSPTPASNPELGYSTLSGEHAPDKKALVAEMKKGLAASSSKWTEEMAEFRRKSEEREEAFSGTYSDYVVYLENGKLPAPIPADANQIHVVGGGSGLAGDNLGVLGAIVVPLAAGIRAPAGTTPQSNFEFEDIKIEITEADVNPANWEGAYGVFPETPPPPPPISTPLLPLGTLTHEEAIGIQALADKYNTQIDVVGSRARGAGRNIGTDLPVGKGEATRSDIDFRYDGQVEIDTGGHFTPQLRAIGNGAGSPSYPIGAIVPSTPPFIRFVPGKGFTFVKQ